MILIKISLAPSEIREPWHAFFGNPEKQISDFEIFNQKYEESDATFVIRVPIQFNTSQIIVNMATLNIKILFSIRNCLKTDILPRILIPCSLATKMIFYVTS